MTDFAAEVAATLATKGAEALVGGGASAARALVHFVRDRLGQRSREAVVLHAAIDHPDDQARRAELAAVLAETMVRDPVFAERVRTHWSALSTGSTADHGGVVNQFDGRADKVVQARDINGDIAF